MAITRTPRKSSSGTTTKKSNSAFDFGYGAGLGAYIYSAPTSYSGGSSSGSGGSSGGGGGGSYSSGSGGGGGAVSSGSWTCPSGATLVREPGSSNLVCRWNHNGSYFAAQPVGGGSSGGGTGTGTAPDATGEWLQSAGDIMARDPQAMLAVRLKDQYGDSGGNGLYGMLDDYADAANALFLAQTGASANTGSVDEFLGYLDNYWTALQTPGGRIDTAGALNNIVNAAEGSPLHAYLTTGDPRQQANAALGLFRGALETGYHPAIASAILEKLNLERDRYLGDAARGKATGSFIDYAGANIPNFSSLFK